MIMITLQTVQAIMDTLERGATVSNIEKRWPEATGNQVFALFIAACEEQVLPASQLLPRLNLVTDGMSGREIFYTMTGRFPSKETLTDRWERAKRWMGERL